jgi:hypothetical protein
MKVRIKRMNEFTINVIAEESKVRDLIASIKEHVR